MFKNFLNRKTINEQEEKERLKSLPEKELLIELILELKKINCKCEDIARRIVIWSN